MAQLSFPLKFKRQYAGALDVDAVFATDEDLQAYLNSPLRYAGQMVTCLEHEGKLFILNNDLDTWLEVQGGGEDGGAGGVTAADIIAALDVGAIEAGDVVPEGSTLDAFIQQLLTKTFYPTFTAPSAGLNASMGTNVEAGTIDDLTLTATYNAGAINGNSVGGIWNASTKQADRGGEFISATIDGESTSGSRTLATYQVVDGANAFETTVFFDEGPQPLDSAGEEYDAPLPAGSVNASRTINGRRNMFLGVAESVPTDSAEVRALSSQMNPSNGTTFTINIPVGASHVIFAYPASLRPISSVQYVEGLNAEVREIFTETEIQVAGANGYDPIGYRVYVFTPAEPFTQAATYNGMI